MFRGWAEQIGLSGAVVSSGTLCSSVTTLKAIESHSLLLRGILDTQFYIKCGWCRQVVGGTVFAVAVIVIAWP